jgi:glucan phosphoethanolaminetransferase (alkaline phosphatase superfamily)
MSNYILFGLYLFLLLGIFGFLAIFMMHIRDYRQYSRYITTITRVYLLLMVAIAIFGGYHILNGSIFPQTLRPIQRVNL